MSAFLALALVVSLSIALGWDGAPRAQAYDPKNPDDVYAAMSQNAKSRAQASEQQEGVIGMIAAADAEVADVEQNQIPAANAAAEVAQTNYAAALEKAEKLARRLEAANADRARITQELDQATATYDSSKVAVASLAREEVRGDDQLQSLELISNAGNSDEFVESLETTAAASRTQVRILNNAALVKAGAMNKEARLKIVDELISNLKRQADENREACELSKAKAEQWQQQAHTLQANLIAKKADLERQKANLSALLAEEEANRQKIAADMARLSDEAGASGFDGSGGQFGWPTADHRVTCGYGCYSGHVGTDFGYSGCGASIYASADGLVADEGTPMPGYSGASAIILNHGASGGSTWMTKYLHMPYNGVFVTKGQWVARGQKIGVVGTTGFSTGCHLHFEILKNGRNLDPMSMLGH